MSANPQKPNPERMEGEAVGELVNPLSPVTSGQIAPVEVHPSGHEALQALLAFSSLHEQLRERRAREKRSAQTNPAEVWELEQFVLDEVLHLVAERALNITGADGIAIAMAEGEAIVCRASVGSVAPDAGARLDPNSGFSGACMRSGAIVRCDDSERDPRVNVQACRRLGVRSMVAVPLTGTHGTIGLIEAFSVAPFGFNDSDVRSLNLLAELILAALKPEEESELAQLSHQLVSSASAPIPAASPPLPATSPNAQEATTEKSGPAQVVPPVLQPAGERKPWPARPAMLWLLLALIFALIAAALWWRTDFPTEPNAASSPPAAPTAAAIPAQPADTSPSSGAKADSSAAADSTALRLLVTGIWHVSSADSSTVVIDTQGEVQYEAHRLSDPDRIYFDLHDTALARGLFGKTIEVGDPLLARVRIAQPRRGISRIVLETTGASDFSVSLQSNPYRLVVEIRKASNPGSGAGLRPPELPLPSSRPPSITVPEEALNNGNTRGRAHVPKFRLVLDAGHGGWDLGTVGRKGLMEKDLVLDIVTRVGTLVQNRLGAEVIYTRRDDNYLPLEKRTEIANLAQADMFVSVHANYSDDSSARGAETYYTNTYSSVKARTPGADSDPATAEKVDWTGVDIREKVRQSRRFALAVQQALHRALAAKIPGMRNRGIKRASYVVLTGTAMPAVLAEVSFVSSPADEDKLQSSSYRQSIAEALYKGIAQYAATSRSVKMAAASNRPTGL